MAKTIEEIDKMVMERKEKKATVIQECTKTQDLLRSIEAEIKKAEEAGDISAYTEKKRQLEDTEIKLNFLQSQVARIHNVPAVDMETAKEAWTAYAEPYNNAMELEYQEYKSRKKELCALYRHMIEKQLEMIKIQRRFNRYAGRFANDAETFPAYRVPYMERMQADKPAGILSMYGTPLHDPDALFALSDYCVGKESPYDESEFDKFNFAHTGQALWPSRFET